MSFENRRRGSNAGTVSWPGIDLLEEGADVHYGPTQAEVEPFKELAKNC
jgi:hypothetical protein